MTDTVPLRDFFESKLNALQEQTALALVSSDKALSKAEIATEKRFDSVNEFRKALADQSATLLPRAEYAIQHRGLMDKADLNTERITQLEAHSLGRSQGTSWVGHIVIGVFMGLNTLVAISALLISLLHK